MYRDEIINEYGEAMNNYQLTTGPSDYDPTLVVGTSCHEGAKFKRGSTTRAATIEFTAMALCDVFVGTAGSTVTFYVNALNRRYGKAFDDYRIIGDWEVPSSPTRAFKEYATELIQNCLPRLKENQELSITHAQKNVLDFLTPHHLAEMHSTLTRILEENGGEMKGAALGSIFLDSCYVAKLNKRKFQEQKAKHGSQHWLKALLSTRLRQYSSNTEDVTQHVVMTATHDIKLQPKTGNFKRASIETPATSSSSGLLHPKKRSRPSN